MCVGYRSERPPDTLQAPQGCLCSVEVGRPTRRPCSPQSRSEPPRYKREDRRSRPHCPGQACAKRRACCSGRCFLPAASTGRVHPSTEGGGGPFPANGVDAERGSGRKAETSVRSLSSGPAHRGLMKLAPGSSCFHGAVLITSSHNAAPLALPQLVFILVTLK